MRPKRGIEVFSLPTSRVTYTKVSRGAHVGAARVTVRRDAAPIPAAIPAPRYERMNKAELQARAAALGLDTMGTNAALIERITGKG